MFVFATFLVVIFLFSLWISKLSPWSSDFMADVLPHRLIIAMQSYPRQDHRHEDLVRCSLILSLLNIFIIIIIIIFIFTALYYRWHYLTWIVSSSNIGLDIGKKMAQKNGITNWLFDTVFPCCRVNRLVSIACSSCQCSL